MSGVQTLSFPYCKASNEVLMNMKDDSDNLASGVQTLRVSKVGVKAMVMVAGRDKKN